MSEHDDPDAADWELASGYVDDAIDAASRAQVEGSPALMAKAAQLRAVREGLAMRPFAPPGARDSAVAAALAAFDEQPLDGRPVAAAGSAAPLDHPDGDVEGAGATAAESPGAIATVHDLTAARRRRYRWATGAVAAAVIAIVVVAIRPGADHRSSSADRRPATTQRPAPTTDSGRGGKAESVPVAAPSAASTGPAGAPAVAAPGTAPRPSSPPTVAAATGAIPSTIAAPAVGPAVAPDTTTAAAATTMAGTTTVPFGASATAPGASGGPASSPSATSVPEIDSPGQLLALPRPNTTAANANPAGTVATDQAATTTAVPPACLPEHAVVLATITYQGRRAVAVVDDARHVREALDSTTCALLAQVADTP